MTPTLHKLYCFRNCALTLNHVNNITNFGTITVWFSYKHRERSIFVEFGREREKPYPSRIISTSTLMEKQKEGNEELRKLVINVCFVPVVTFFSNIQDISTAKVHIDMTP